MEDSLRGSALKRGVSTHRFSLPFMTIRSPRSFIEQLSHEHFESLLRLLGSEGPFPERGGNVNVSAGVNLYYGLDEAQQADFLEVLDRAAPFGDERGRNAILIAAGFRRDLFGKEMVGHQGPIDSALWCLLEHPEVFEQAETIFRADCKRERAHEFIGTFLTDPAPTLDRAALPLEALEAGLTTAYQARGDRCEGVVLTVEERIVRTQPLGRRIEILIHRKGRPVTSHIFDGAQPVLKRLVPVMPDTICIDPETGLVEVISQHGDTHRERLATTFCDVGLGREPPTRVERMRVMLSALRHPRLFQPSIEHGVRTVRLFEIRTRVGKGGYETVRAEDGQDVYEFMGRRGTLHLLAGDIARTAFEIWFNDGQSNSKGRAHKLVLAGDNAISFPKWSAHRQEIGKRLLREWGLVEE